MKKNHVLFAVFMLLGVVVKAQIAGSWKRADGTTFDITNNSTGGVTLLINGSNSQAANLKQTKSGFYKGALVRNINNCTTRIWMSLEVIHDGNFLLYEI